MHGTTLILSGSTGIAAATARLAAAAGARLLIATAESDSGWELAAETAAECWIGDLARPEAAESVVALAVQKFGRVDALFNASGMSGRRFGDGPAHQVSDDGWELTVGHNLKAAFHMCRAAVARMLEQDVDAAGIRGSILNMGSVLAESPEPRFFAMHAYAAAKGGLASFSRSMASYYAPHKIRVNVIAPGVVRTPASARAVADSELSAFLPNKQPLTGDMVDAQDIARAALFLLGPDARSITGEILTVDGGWSVTNS
jgi:NAD(P)-dependent dehydrogenase (short-subunit alcohol dehydrogenase family)